MMFELPDDDILYAALLARNPAFDGRAYVGVTSTGVFCRLTCPARKPKRENCQFFDQIGSCIEAGYRACKRCHPMAPAAEADLSVARLLDALSKKTCASLERGGCHCNGVGPFDGAPQFQTPFWYDLS